MGEEGMGVRWLVGYRVMDHRKMCAPFALVLSIYIQVYAYIQVQT